MCKCICDYKYIYMCKICSLGVNNVPVNRVYLSLGVTES